MTEELPQRLIDLIEAGNDRAFEIMVEQSKVNPEAFEALYN